MSKVQRVVSIGAHSLDAELMGGPLLLKYAKQGAHCTCMHVTQGRLEDPNATKEECDAYLKELLDQNQRAALNKLQILFLFDSLKGFCLIFFFPMGTALCRGSF